MPDHPRRDGNYKCGSCKNKLEVRDNEESDQHADNFSSPKELLTEFIKAIDQEIAAIKAGKGGSVARVFGGTFIRVSSGIFLYSFTLENFIAAIDDAPVEVQIDSQRYQGQIIQTRGLEIVIGLEHNFGASIPEALLITNLYFLHEMLKKKFQAVGNGESRGTFSLANMVFSGLNATSLKPISLPSLEPHPEKKPNESQFRAIHLSQQVPLSLVWGPPGTGKTETLARIAECFIKMGNRVLVVAHANAAVDEATEDIAHILKATEFYNNGQIIRLGNYQKDTLEREYELVLIEKIALKLGQSLAREKEMLEQEKSSIEDNLNSLNDAVKALKEREELSKKIAHLRDSLSNCQKNIRPVEQDIAQLNKELEKLKGKLQTAESSSNFVRMLRRLDPVKIRSEIYGTTVKIDSKKRQLSEREKQLQEIKQQLAAAEADHISVKQKIKSLLAKLKLSETELVSREQELTAEKNEIISKINEIQKQLDEIQKRVLEEAKIVCTTLTKTFTAKAFPDKPFDALIVDEASMAPMPYLYWALSRCKKACVIVGDFLQLPPICISDEDMAKKWFGRSIYQHLHVDTVPKARQHDKIRLLETQYRMNPSISALPNQLFYDGLLIDHISTHKKVVSEGISSSPLNIIDTSLAFPWCSRLSTRSRFNVYHALVAATVAKRILRSTNNELQVGIISPFAAQARLIGKMIKDLQLDSSRVRVSTVHRFQGGESDFIIFDTVESPGVKLAPMLDDNKEDSNAPLLFNVAMTRAQSKIFFIANMEYLKNQLSPQTIFYRIIDTIRKNGQIIGSNEIVDSYFIRDFESWVEKLFKSAPSEPPGDSLFSEKNFYPAFFEDLRRAKEEVIILSPFVSINRAGKFIEYFKILIRKGIKVKVFTRPAKEQTGTFSLNGTEVINQMRSIGVEIAERKRMHQKVAIIDRSVAWEGSLNILSHRDSNEQMRRLPFSVAVGELIRLCELDDASTGTKREPILTREKCPQCMEEMVVRIGRYGAFLSCPDKSCKGKKNINKWDKIETHSHCPDCNRAMIIRQGPKGHFLGCSGYPDCRKTKPIR
jgi:ssDNA-binding Zn-finger/Zn-ribbon topoisomerase 1